MSKKVFISYRRNDTEGYAGRIYDRLSSHYKENNIKIFMDVDNIELGQDFVIVLQTAVSDCSVMLVLIGPKWLSVTDAHGKPRLSNPNDFVRLEIAMALQRNIQVIPVLLGGAVMPSPEDLPEDLKPLSRRNALDIRHDSFGSDFIKLEQALGFPLEKVKNTIAVEEIEDPIAEHIINASELDDELYQIGLAWLDDSGTVSSWPRVWKKLYSENPTDDEVNAIGFKWLYQFTGNICWPDVLFCFLENTQSEYFRKELVELGKAWLDENLKNKQWENVFRRLKSISPTDQELLALQKSRLENLF